MEELVQKVESLEKKTSDSAIKKLISKTVRNELENWLSETTTINNFNKEILRINDLRKKELEDSKLSQKKVEFLLKEQEKKLGSCFEDIQKLQVYLEETNFELKEKAFNVDVHKLEEALKSYCPMSAINSVQEEIKSLAREDDIKTALEELETIKEDLELYCTKNQAKLDLEELQREFEETLLKYTKKKELKALSDNLNNQIQKLNEETKSLDESIKLSSKRSKEQSNKILLELKEKADQKDLEKVKIAMIDKASRDELNKVWEEVQPKLEEFHEEIENFRATQQRQEEAVSRFDEILLDKASKLEVTDLKVKFSKLLKNYNLETKIDTMTSKFSEISKKYQEAENTLKEVKQQNKDILTFYSKRNHEMLDMKLAKEQIQELYTKISCKSDRGEVLSWLQQKVPLQDFQNTNKSLEFIHKQVKILAVQLHTLQYTYFTPSRAKGTMRTHQEQLSKMTQKVMDFIVDSKPESETLHTDVSDFIKLPYAATIKPSKPNTPKEPRARTPQRRMQYSFENIKTYY